MKLIQMIIILFIFSMSSYVLSQVNTETMRKEQTELGISQNTELSFTYIATETEIYFINSSYRLDYKWHKNWKSFIVANYEHAFEKGEEDLNYQGFLHFRNIGQIKEKKYMEYFLQKEFNHFIDLQNRELYGLGLRLQFQKYIFIGSGLMYEKELYENNVDNIFLKSTNYINHSLALAENINLQNVLYYQTKFKNMNHYRILWEGKVTIQGSEKVLINLKINYRYDISDINPKGNQYFEMANGLEIHF